MTRCTRCLYPRTKPDLAFDANGVCSACTNFRNRPTIDWAAHKRELEAILETGKNGTGYDCIVPSSGGKDSHYQALTLIDMGARPLIVTASTDYLTPIGRANIDNLARYATTIEVTPNRSVRAKLCRLGLEMVGDVSWGEHASIFSVPFRIASSLGIPLVFFGENSQDAYGGPPGSEKSQTLTARWRSEYGGLLGLRPSDFIGQEGITAADMADYVLPNDDAMAKVTAYFLGQFIPWDSRRNAEAARLAGMRTQLPSPANFWDFENVDNLFTGAHDFLCWLKYGFGRATAQLSVDVRNGLLSRDEALPIAERRDGWFPEYYTGVSFDDGLRYMDMSRVHFLRICNAFMNKELFVEPKVEWGQQITLNEQVMQSAAA